MRGEEVENEVREKAGSQSLHIGPEHHCEDFGCYSRCDGNPRKADSFTCCHLDTLHPVHTRPLSSRFLHFMDTAYAWPAACHTPWSTLPVHKIHNSMQRDLSRSHSDSPDITECCPSLKEDNTLNHILPDHYIAADN